MGLRMAEPFLSARGSCQKARAEAQRAEAQKDWLAVYTRTQHESSVAQQLEAKQVACLLPTYLKHNPRFVWEICREMVCEVMVNRETVVKTQ